MGAMEFELGIIVDERGKTMASQEERMLAGKLYNVYDKDLAKKI